MQDSQPKTGSRQDSLEGSVLQIYSCKYCFLVLVHDTDSNIFLFLFTCAIIGEASQNGSSGQNGVPNTAPMLLNQTMAVVPMPAGAAVGPTTNLNIGMDYWGAPTSGMRGKVPAATPPVAAGIVTAGSRDSSQSQLWLQVEFFDLYLFTNLFLCILFQSLCYFNLNFFLKKKKRKKWAASN